MTLDELTEVIRELRTLNAVSSDDVAAAVERELKSTAAAGQSPDGNPWEATQAGGTPLKNAASQIKVSKVSTPARTTVTASIGGHYAFHHNGWANGAPARRVLPDKLTPELSAAIKAAITANFKKLSDG